MFQLSVLLLELLEFPELAHAQAAALLLPAAEGRLRDPQLAADLPDRRAGLLLLQRHRDLLLHKPALKGGSPAPPGAFRSAPFLAQNVSRRGSDSGEETNLTLLNHK